MKKNLKEEYRRQREKKLSEGKIWPAMIILIASRNPDAVLLPDMAVPLGFDSDCHVHRYRSLVTSDQWPVRPVLDPQGWDHDIGFDGISVETAAEINRTVFASVTGQMSKEKQDFSIQSECGSLLRSWGTTYSVGLDVQTAGKDLIYILHGDTKLRNLWHNVASCGVLWTSLGNRHYIGAKAEDSVSVGKRLKFVVNAAKMAGLEQVAYGGSFEAILRDRDYPVRNDNVSLIMTALSFNKETVLGGILQSEFQISRNLRMSVNANLNSRKMGQICIKTSSSEHLQIALIAAFTIFKGLTRRKTVDRLSQEASESR
ncbi:hypothetical protein FNV43_RR03505 [Rhamnella rubrinervis]|uniref:Translocase of chloroplast 159/132 membrane anchor domain-containing protein n=1 Tax=Rhamnella rubrinervis TaxID=2594499 RepID=A0A8K0HI41_9ROSA|nr:hypothetical protein FNV43_RR03505 [Rhamnella rubrinervis]